MCGPGDGKKWFFSVPGGFAVYDANKKGYLENFVCKGTTIVVSFIKVTSTL